MRIRFATLFDRFSNLGAWIAVAGTFLLVGGLVWDVSIHEASPGLAAHESAFAIDNPAHVVFLAGIGLIVVGMLGFLGGQVRAARSTRRLRLATVTAVTIALALTAAVGAASAVGPSSPPHRRTPRRCTRTGSPARPVITRRSSLPDRVASRRGRRRRAPSRRPPHSWSLP